MTRILTTTIALFFLQGGLLHSAGYADSSWSSPVNGLQARLILARTQPENGTILIATHLELCNVSYGAGVMEVPFKDSAIQFEVVSEQGEKLAPTNQSFDGISIKVGTLRLPFDSCLRFNISEHGSGIPKNQAAALDLGVGQSWVIRRGDKRAYYLRARFSVEKAKDPLWWGMLEIPKAKIPIAK
jgi:hypothetical protein